jgi:hypothetical protein
MAAIIFALAEEMILWKPCKRGEGWKGLGARWAGRWTQTPLGMSTLRSYRVSVRSGGHRSRLHSYASRVTDQRAFADLNARVFEEVSMRNQSQGVEQYARMWPREIFYSLVPNQSGSKRKTAVFAKGLELLNEPGVYVLYRNDIPYYVGQAANKLRYRLWAHAWVPGERYHNFWNYFSAFVIRNTELRNLVEGILIASMPTANGAKPRLKKTRFPASMTKMTRDMYRYQQVNPRPEIERLNRLVKKLIDSLP